MGSQFASSSWRVSNIPSEPLILLTRMIRILFIRGMGAVALFQLVLPIVFLLVGWDWVRYQGSGIEDVNPPNLKCPELEAGVSKAKASLPGFLREVEKGVDGAYIKFPLHTAQGLTEYIWAYVHFFKDGTFNVSLANQPYDEKEKPLGRRDVPLEQIVDWQIIQPDGKIRGAYSLIALFEHWQSKGKPLSPRMKKQKALLLDFQGT